MHPLSFKNSLLHHKEISSRPISFIALKQLFNTTSKKSLEELLIQMGPFVAKTDAFRFTNSFTLTAKQIKEVWSRFGPSLYQLIADIGGKHVLDVILNKFPRGSLPDIIIDEAISSAVADIVEFFINLSADEEPPRFGRCGGMAFAGYDFYKSNWVVDERFGTEPPESGTLSDYIFTRLLDSLDLNVGHFLRWILHLHVMPIISKTVSAIIYAGVGTTILPIIGTAIGAYVGYQEDIFLLGGPKKTLKMTKDEEWPKIKKKLDQEAACPIGFIYGDSANPTNQHQVLAIGYIDNNDNKPILTVWNNNHANTHDDLHVDFTGDELEVSNSGGKHPIKGFFLEEYSYNQPPPTLKLSRKNFVSI